MEKFTVEQNDNKIELVFHKPTATDIDESEAIYAAKVAQLLRSHKDKRLLLREQLDKYLKEEGIWTEEDEEKTQKLQEEVDDLLAKMRRGGMKLSEGRAVAIQVLEKRKELTRAYAKRRVFDDATVEHIAEEEKVDYLVYCSVCNEDGGNYWASFEDMKNDKDSEVYSEGLKLVYKNVFGIDSEFEKKLPENQWLKKYGFVDDKLMFTDRKTGKYVDKDGNPVEDLETKLKSRLDNLQGEIKEESPFIDDETGEAVAVDQEERNKEEEKEVETEEPAENV